MSILCYPQCIRHFLYLGNAYLPAGMNSPFHNHGSLRQPGLTLSSNKLADRKPACIEARTMLVMWNIHMWFQKTANISSGILMISNKNTSAESMILHASPGKQCRFYPRYFQHIFAKNAEVLKLLPVQEQVLTMFHNALLCLGRSEQKQNSMVSN